MALTKSSTQSPRTNTDRRERPAEGSKAIFLHTYRNELYRWYQRTSNDEISGSSRNSVLIKILPRNCISRKLFVFRNQMLTDLYCMSGSRSILASYAKWWPIPYATDAVLKRPTKYSSEARLLMGQVGQEFSNNIAMLAIWLMKRFKLVWEDLFRI